MAKMQTRETGKSGRRHYERHSRPPCDKKSGNAAFFALSIQFCPLRPNDCCACMPPMSEKQASRTMVLILLNTHGTHREAAVASDVPPLLAARVETEG